MSLTADLQRLGNMKRKEAILKKRAAKATVDRELFERECYDRMEGEGFAPNDSDVKLGALRYAPHFTRFAKIQDKSKLIEYLRENDEELFDVKLRQKELNRLVRQKLDDGEELPPGLGYYEKRTISTTGIANRKEQEAPDAEE